MVLAVFTDLAVGDAVTAEYRPLFWLETVAVLAFGVSWLVKGEALLGDRREDGRGRWEAAQVRQGPV